MIELTITKDDTDSIKKMLENLSPKKQDGVIHRGILKASGTVLRQLVANVSGLILKRRTGNLAKSMGYRIGKDKEGNYKSIIGSGASLKTARMIYANIHETGGIIKPRPENKTGYLCIPIRSGSDQAYNLYASGKLSLSGAGFKIKGNRLVGKSSSSKILEWRKVKQVTIPARRYMSITVEQTKDRVVENIIDKIKEAKEKA